jgi:hypothetical protein
MLKPRFGSLRSELPAPRLGPKILRKGSVLQAQRLSFGLDTLSVMRKAPHTTPDQTRTALWLGAAVKATGTLISKRGNLRSARKASLGGEHGDFLRQLQLALINCYIINISNY